MKWLSEIQTQIKPRYLWKVINEIIQIFVLLNNVCTKLEILYFISGKSFTP